MTQSGRMLWLAVFVAALLLMPLRASAQDGTVTDDGFLSLNANTQKGNLGGYGGFLTVAGASATVGTTQVGSTKSYIKFDLGHSLPPGSPQLTAADIAKATLKLFISPSCSPMGSIAIYPVTSVWSETTLNSSAPPALASTPFATGIAVGKPDSFVVVDVTGLVKQWVEGLANSGIDNDGIALVAETVTTNVSFDSKDNAITSHEPRLEIVLTNSGPPGTAATIAIGTTSTVAPNVSASVTNSGTANAAIFNFSIPQGQTGATGQTGPAGQAATINVAPAMTVPPSMPASVMTSGPANSPTLTFLIPQGATGATGAQGPQGAVGINNKGAWSKSASYNPTDAVFDSASYWLATAANSNSEPSLTNSNWQLLAGGIVNRGAWSAASSYNVNDAVSDQGSFWLALVPTSASTASPNTSCEPSQTACAGDWQLLAQQGAQGPQGQTGQQGLQGIQGLVGIQGPPGPVPLNVAVTNANNNFTTAQNIGGNVSITGAGNGLVFPDGTVQTTASIGGGPTCTAPFEVSSASPITPPGYIPFGTVTTGNFWSPFSALPAIANVFAAASVNNKLYVFGGFTSCCLANNVEIFDPGSNAWTAGASMPTAREGAAAVALNGNIYVLGGGITSTSPVGAPTVTSTNVVEIYNPSSNSWSTGAALNTARRGFAAVALNGLIYAIGGFGSTGRLFSVEAFDPNTNAWTAAPSLSQSRSNLRAVVLNGKIFALGGLTFSAAPVNIVEVYDPVTTAWTVGVPMPTARAAFGVDVLGGKLYAAGGSIGLDPNGNSLFTSVVEVYDSTSNSWSTAASLPSAVTGVMGDANGYLYMVGEDVGNGTSVYQYAGPPGTIYTFIKN